MARTALPEFGLVQACDDPNLFGFELWPEQRKLLAQVEAGPRMHVWSLGRRSGKSTMAALVCLWSCLGRGERLIGRLRPGERGYAVAVATSIDQARLIVDAADSIISQSPLLSDLVTSQTADEIQFANGTALRAFPCSARTRRGWPIFCLVMDEAAHFLSDTEGPQVAEKVYAALSPATAQFADDARLLFVSTPYGESGLFATLFQQAASGEIEDARAVRAATREVNPTIGPEFLERERRRLGEDEFRSEYLAHFVGSGAAYLDPERLAECVAERGELPPSACVDWVAGLDPAFSSDPFGLAIVGRDPWDGTKLALGLARSWKPLRASSFEEQAELRDAVLDEVALVCQHYGVSRVVTDQYAAPAIVDYLRRRGLAVFSQAMTQASKTAVFGALRARINLSGIELYEHPQLLAELRRLRARFAANAASVVNPRVGGSHGDMAQALALAVAEHDRFGLGGTPAEAQEDTPLPQLTQGIERVAAVGPSDDLFAQVF